MLSADRELRSVRLMGKRRTYPSCTKDRHLAAFGVAFVSNRGPTKTSASPEMATVEGMYAVVPRVSIEYRPPIHWVIEAFRLRWRDTPAGMLEARMPADPLGDNSDSSVNLLTRARNGDREALERLGARHRPELRRWARGRLPAWARDAVDTDDLVQDALMQTVRRIDAFRPHHDGALQGYLRQALQNRIRDEVRRRRRRPDRTSIDAEAAVDGASPLEAAIGTENLERYEAALATMRPEDRELIVLRIELGMSYDDLANAVGKPSANAARMAVMRALLRLAEELAREA